MEVELTDDQQTFVRLGVESGRYRGEADAVREALSLWEERERRRLEILAAIDLAEASYARGEGTVISSQAESERLAADIKERGRQRLAATIGQK
jgi:putative addiction module CopG family antidote